MKALKRAGVVAGALVVVVGGVWAVQKFSGGKQLAKPQVTPPFGPSRGVGQAMYAAPGTSGASADVANATGAAVNLLSLWQKINPPTADTGGNATPAMVDQVDSSAIDMVPVDGTELLDTSI